MDNGASPCSQCRLRYNREKLARRRGSSISPIPYRHYSQAHHQPRVREVNKWLEYLGDCMLIGLCITGTILFYGIVRYGAVEMYESQWLAIVELTLFALGILYGFYLLVKDIRHYEK